MTVNEHMLSWQEKHVRFSNGKIPCEDQEKENRTAADSGRELQCIFYSPEAQELGAPELGICKNNGIAQTVEAGVGVVDSTCEIIYNVTILSFRLSHSVLVFMNHTGLIPSFLDHHIHVSFLPLHFFQHGILQIILA